MKPKRGNLAASGRQGDNALREPAKSKGQTQDDSIMGVSANDLSKEAQILTFYRPTIVVLSQKEVLSGCTFQRSLTFFDILSKSRNEDLLS